MGDGSNGAEQRVKKLKRVKQRVNQQYYPHVHHWPPQQQYKSRSWTIAIILKLTFVAWDFERIDFDTNSVFINH